MECLSVVIANILKDLYYCSEIRNLRQKLCHTNDSFISVSQQTGALSLGPSFCNTGTFCTCHATSHCEDLPYL